MGWSSDGLRARVAACRESRKLVLIIVAIALLLDNMLLTTVENFLDMGLQNMSNLRRAWTKYILQVLRTVEVCLDQRAVPVSWRFPQYHH
ncbi:hypothetical protein KGM_215028 [Danaus plexippus plexippus]|uniref:Uncharacterized protein n=1 Tax=Danaus plexippus plexippus TaxID=278856 RepID=A0A212FLA2_DANPL|nr:hypothetical protein KGM_215028 [Danaus plexippus plexippus]